VKHLLLAVLLTFAAAATTLAADPARTLLTSSALSKLKAVDAELRGARLPDTDDADDGDVDVEQFARLAERTPAVKAALRRQNLTGMDFALYSHAMLHATTFLLFEKSLERRKANELLASYTPEQRANIETVRKFAHARP